VSFAGDHRVRSLCLELHGHQNAYNVRMFQRLRAAVGQSVGVNLDPSHLLWIGADPIAVVTALSATIHHMHATDTRIEQIATGVDGRLETEPNDTIRVNVEFRNGRLWAFRGVVGAIRGRAGCSGI
jgi:sugar phosphate isomerase/epimerase